MKKHGLEPINEKYAIWVLATEDGSFLFHGNPNPNFPPYHIGGLHEMVNGQALVYEHTKNGILIDGVGKLFNISERVSKRHHVRPRRVMLEVRDYANTPRTKKQKKGAPNA